MSILNAVAPAKSIAVAVDTMGRNSEGSEYEYSKLLYLPHANTLFALRGDRVSLVSIWAAYALSDRDVTFDDIDASILETARAHVRESTQSNRQVAPFTLLIGGFSETRQGFGLRLVEYDGSATVKSEDKSGKGHIGPWEESTMGPAPAASENPNDLLEIARRQASYLESVGAPGGGRLIVAQVTRTGCTFRDAGNIRIE